MCIGMKKIISYVRTENSMSEQKTLTLYLRIAKAVDVTIILKITFRWLEY